jgi:hypothetical protein
MNTLPHCVSSNITSSWAHELFSQRPHEVILWTPIDSRTFLTFWISSQPESLLASISWTTKDPTDSGLICVQIYELRKTDLCLESERWLANVIGHRCMNLPFVHDCQQEHAHDQWSSPSPVLWPVGHQRFTRFCWCGTQPTHSISVRGQ